MYIIMIVAAIFTLGVWFFGSQDFLDGLAAGAIGASMGFFIALIIGGFYPTEPTAVEREEIIMMADSTGMSWSLFGGSSGPSFRYYTETDDGIVLKEKLAEGSFIYEDSTEPYLEKICPRDNAPKHWAIKETRNYGCKYEFHIPEGSIQPGVNLDGG